MARRLTYTPETGRELCGLIADGRSMREACEKLDIPRRTFRDWLTKHSEFEDEYERSRRLRADGYEDEIVEIADSVADVADPAKVQAARLRVDARKWLMSKHLPHRFGDSLAVTGKDGRDLIPAEADPTRIALAVLGVIRAAEEMEGELAGIATDGDAAESNDGSAPAEQAGPHRAALAPARGWRGRRAPHSWPFAPGPDQR